MLTMTMMNHVLVSRACSHLRRNAKFKVAVGQWAKSLCHAPLAPSPRCPRAGARFGPHTTSGDRDLMSAAMPKLFAMHDLDAAQQRVSSTRQHREGHRSRIAAAIGIAESNPCVQRFAPHLESESRERRKQAPVPPCTAQDDQLFGEKGLSRQLASKPCRASCGLLQPLHAHDSLVTAKVYRSAKCLS